MDVSDFIPTLASKVVLLAIHKRPWTTSINVTYALSLQSFVCKIYMIVESSVDQPWWHCIACPVQTTNPDGI